MISKIIAKASIPELIQSLMAKATIVAPMERGKSPAAFVELQPGDQPIIDGSRMTTPPKDYLLPRYEQLMTIGTRKGHEHVDPTLPEDKRRVMLGVWLPDAQALRVVDKVFLDEKFKDPYYAIRRESTTLVGVLPAKLRWSWFCSSVDDVNTWKDSVDVLMYDLADRFYVEAHSGRGEELIDSPLFTDPSDADTAARDNLWSEFAGMSREDFADSPLYEQLCWDDPVWADIAQRCISCGTCSYMCPSCTCFDIQDECHDGCTSRYRCRDTCQFEDFTLMGAGHNPRHAQLPRSRQRLLHKFKYQHEQFGVVACTGCGRCIELCPVNIDIRDALNRTCQVKEETPA